MQSSPQVKVFDYQSGPLLRVAAPLGLVPQPLAMFMNLMVPDGASFIDRTGGIEFGLRLVAPEPIPTRLSCTSTFPELMARRARELIRKRDVLNPERRIDVYWSGGMDSTGALCALLQERIDRYRIVLTTSSIAEHPNFFDSVISARGLPFEVVAPGLIPAIDPEALIVTGEIGDQLFGSVKIRRYAENFSPCLDEHWHSHMLRVAPDKSSAQVLVDIGEQIAKAAPFKLINTFDFLWWLNFSCKYQHVLTRMAAVTSRPLDTYAATVHFYNTDYFQSWSMNVQNHISDKVERDFQSYKLALRKYILAQTQDWEYFRTKVKIGSLPLKYAKPYLFVLESGEKIFVSNDGRAVRADGSEFNLRSVFDLEGV
jgi:hypothetical protein